MNTPNYNEFELLWKEQDEKLEKSMRLNEKLLTTISMKNASDDFGKLLRITLLGRNLAFVYYLISVYLSVLCIHDLQFSIPGLISACCMLGSFIYHLSYTLGLKADDDHSTSIVAFQKKINHFKIRALAAARYDLVIMAVWVVALVPLLVHVVLDKNLYEYVSAERYWGVSVILLLLYLPINQKMYSKMYGEKLSQAEAQLQEVIEFETK